MMLIDGVEVQMTLEVVTLLIGSNKVQYKVTVDVY